MRRTTTLAAALLAATAALTACSSGPKHYADDQAPVKVQQACVTALDHRADGDKGKPKDCEPLSDHDYNALLLGKTLQGMGLTGH